MMMSHNLDREMARSPRGPSRWPGQACVGTLAWLVVGMCSAASPLPPSPFPPSTADGLVVLSRMLQPLLPTSVSSANKTALEATALETSLLPNGSWADVPYTDQTRGDWLAMAHLSRVKLMAVSVRSPLSPLANSTAMLTAANAAIKFWLAGRYQNPNWYWNEIGVPQALGDIFLLLEGRGLDPADVRLALGAIGKAQTSSCSGDCGGANVADMATITVQEGLVTGNNSLVQSGLARIYADIAVFPQGGEGLQSDLSFHQHGPELLSGSYGVVFVGRMLQAYQLTSGTVYRMPPAKVTLLCALLLDHMRWVITPAGSWAWAVLGRSIASAGTHRASFSIAALEAINQTLPSDRQAEMTAFVATLGQAAGQAQGTDPLVGNKHFWDSDCMVQRRPSWMLVSRLRSARTVAARCINGQCLRAQHVADGSLQLYPADWSSTNRYTNMFPVWDWHALPGITALVDSPFFACDPKKSEAIGYNWPLLMPGAAFVGGVSDGQYGCTAMAFAKPPLLSGLRDFSLQRSHFMLDDAVVVLGAALDIGAAGAFHRGGGVATTIANDALGLGPQHGSDIYCGAVLHSKMSPGFQLDSTSSDGAAAAMPPVLVPPGNHTYTSDSVPSYFWVNGTGYVVLLHGASATDVVELNITNRTGSWASLGTPSPAAPLTKATVSLRILHGDDATGFGYVLLPVVRLEDMPAAAATYRRETTDGLRESADNAGAAAPAALPQILNNSAQLQAVFDAASAQVQATFWNTAVTITGAAHRNASANALANDAVLVVPAAVLGADTRTTVSMPSALLIRRANATTVLVSASGVNVGGTLVITVQGSNIVGCSGAATFNSAPPLRYAMHPTSTKRVASLASHSNITFQLPTDANSLGLSMQTVCTLAA
eukprot:m.366355 g.366355  ORF g.366355 m.366355 type:complete len:885 (+) comp28094_c0_seq1:108-2762(+)